ncbi:hypothetical protein E3T55_01465 [Cryobacterium frigoriphilum]|uniref:Uncharacterized protein n=1 Tax=Cryobacterium frigoriphilum TaxID=1259150 RepID=A0A4R9AAQ1_9MICO|nr:hypothetical protein [Cryobacterium frigoriphilum]TFD55120.1 hypothetical protein E3T55_01465 [Cryobacterium frigoriphilum]
MTLGNDPQPLTRRQARELADSQAKASTDHHGRHPADNSAPDAPSPAKTDAAPVDSAKADSASTAGAPTDAAPAAPQSAKAARRARSADAAAEKALAKPSAKQAAKATSKPAAVLQADATAKPAVAAKPDVTERPAAESAPVTTERTYTRRELRARNTAAHPAGADDSSVATPSPATPSSAPEPLDDSPAVTQPPAAVRTPMARPSAVRPSPVRPPAPLAVDDSVPIPPVPANHGRPAVSRQSSPTPAPFDASRLPGLHPPVGHWSVDSDDDEPSADVRPASYDRARPFDEAEPFDQIMARGLGAGGIPTTTNALILPSIPNQGSTSGPLTDSGEILITGSFDLPRSLGSTGQLPNHFDSSEMDHMLDQFDDDGAPGAAAPVSASRAVSTHASTRNVMAAPKRRLPSLPAVLAITAAVLALGVLALFVGGYLLNIF